MSGAQFTKSHVNVRIFLIYSQENMTLQGNAHSVELPGRILKHGVCLHGIRALRLQLSFEVRRSKSTDE